MLLCNLSNTLKHMHLMHFNCVCVLVMVHTVHLQVMFFMKTKQIGKVYFDTLATMRSVPTLTSSPRSHSDTLPETRTQLQGQTSSTFSEISKHNRNLEQLFETISKVSALSIVIAVSSLLYFIVFGVCSNYTVVYPLIWIMISIDSCFNMVCLIFAFEFSNNLYLCFCGCCRKCCMHCVKM